MNRILRVSLLAVATTGLLIGCGGGDDETPAPPPVAVTPPPPPPPPPEWSTPVAVGPGGCPIESRDGKLLYTAAGPADSNGLDIWAYRRDGATYDSRTKLGAPVSVADANDFCPTPVMGDYLMFVSTRSGAEKCGEPGAAPGLTGSDMYVTRYGVERPAASVSALQMQSFGEPKRLACYPDGPNTKGTSFSPSLLTTADGGFLFYSSNHNGVSPTGSQDIFVSQMGPDGSYGPGTPVAALNTTFEDQQPNVARDGLSIVFASNRGGNMDIYIATRAKVTDDWSALRNLSVELKFPTVGSAETRPSLSWDLQRLYYGADGQSYTSTRAKTN
jgi:hypothetical protein